MITKIQMCIAFTSSSSRSAVVITKSSSSPTVRRTRWTPVITEAAIRVDNDPFAFHNSLCLVKLKHSSVTCVNENFVAHLIYSLFMLKIFCVINFCGFHCPQKFFTNETFPDYSICHRLGKFYHYRNFV